MVGSKLEYLILLYIVLPSFTYYHLYWNTEALDDNT